MKTASLPEQWIARSAQPSYWPNVQVAGLAMPEPVLEAPNPRNFGIADPSGAYPQSVPDRLRGGDREVPLPPIVLWPRGIKLVALIPAADAPRSGRGQFPLFPRVGAPLIRARGAQADLQDGGSGHRNLGGGAKNNDDHPARRPQQPAAAPAKARGSSDPIAEADGRSCEPRSRNELRSPATSGARLPTPEISGDAPADAG